MQNNIVKPILFIILASLFWGCGPQIKTRISFEQLVEPLGDPSRIARIDERETLFISSSDPTGGNNDFNRPLRVESDGWWVIADLKGPGYVSRFWFTGGDQAHGIRLYFDNERVPRIDATIAEFCGGQEPFKPPFADHENFCYYNYIPIPYNKRLVIMVEPGDYKPGNWPRIFHQINYSSLPRGTDIESLSLPLSETSSKALMAAAEKWSFTGQQSRNDSSDTVSNKVSTTQRAILILPPGATETAPIITGPAIISEIRLTPKQKGVSAADTERFLRDVIIRMRWNNTKKWSVESPIGDLFGSFWQRIPYESLFFGLREETLFSRFPMPFEESAEMELENQGPNEIEIEIAFDSHAISWDNSTGYFHAAWRRSSPHDLGRPHEILETQGRGRFAGCVLSVTSLDKSFWILEGDEIMWRDGEAKPFWDGTGLEDYFNGGWYYQNVIAMPLHGLPFKTFFRTIQYRIHLPDAITFKNAFRMIFERGPEHDSRGWMESIAYYYMDTPQQAPSTIMTPADRLPPEDQFTQVTVMPELCNYERFGDYKGARRFIDRFLARHPEFPFSEMLRLRQVAYTEKIEGFEVAKPLYQNMASNTENENVRNEANDLLWFHESPYNALLGLYCNTPTIAWINGQTASQARNPERMTVARVKLSDGPNVLALQMRHHPYPDWILACLRTHQNDICTTPEWKHAFNPKGPWRDINYKDDNWTDVGGLGVKGPPEEPFLWMEPNAFIDMQSRAIGIRPTVDWPDTRQPMIFRKRFVFHPPEQID